LFVGVVVIEEGCCVITPAVPQLEGDVAVGAKGGRVEGEAAPDGCK
jgi:hypothetical protein